MLIIGSVERMTAKIGKVSRKNTVIHGEKIPGVTIPFENRAGKFIVEIDNCGLSVTMNGCLIIHLIHETIYLRKAVSKICEPIIQFDVTPDIEG